MSNLFTKDYDENFCKKNGYSFACPELQKLKYDYEYNFSYLDKEDQLITAGYGMNSTPHIMTALQILRMVELQKAGYNTQIVLGDYDVMLARGFSDSEKISNTYKNFLLLIGYDDTNGILRTQTEAQSVAANIIYLSSKVQDEDFVFAKEDLVDYYKNDDNPMDFPTKLSIMLMLSDFISPILDGGFKSVIVASGIDESKYSVLANRLVQRLCIDGSIGGIFTKVIKGINNHPKMSKSKPNSGIFLNDDIDTIRKKMECETIYNNECFQCQLALFASKEHSQQEIIEAFDSNRLELIKCINDETIEYIYELASKWQKAIRL